MGVYSEGFIRSHSFTSRLETGNAASTMHTMYRICVKESCTVEQQEIWDEENSAYENLTESIQDSEKGEAMEEGLDAIDDFITALDDGPYYDELDELRNAIGLEE